MDAYSINKQLDKLYAELDKVTTMPFAKVCKKYNVDYKSEAIASINEEIQGLESELHEVFEESDDDMDYDALCRVQGLARYA